MLKKPKRPHNPNQLPKLIIDVATGKAKLPASNLSSSGKNLAAVELGRLGGLKGGKARAEKLSKKKRQEIARLASLARWSKKDD